MGAPTSPSPRSARSASTGRTPRAGDGLIPPLKRKGLLGYFSRRVDPWTSLVLTTPVFLVYHVGLLFTDARNGVDFVSGPMRAVARASLLLYLGLTLAFAAGIVVAGVSLRGRGELHPRALVPLLVESTLWAFVLSVSVGYVTTHLVAATLSAMQVGLRPVGPIDALVLSAGAGFHEELVFRVGLFAGGAFLLTRVAKLGPLLAFLIAALVSSLVFSAAHYVGPFGDAFLLVSFVFRALFGLSLAGLYKARGFAVAVYTHAVYDVFVFAMMWFLRG